MVITSMHYSPSVFTANFEGDPVSVTEGGQQPRRVRHSKRWAGVAAAVCAGIIATALAAVVPASTPVISPPSAVAGTATPWVPRPIFAPIPAPQPRSQVDGQRTTSGSSGQAVDWGTRATQPFQAMQTALNNLGAAVNNSDIAGMQAACRQLSSAGASFSATLPSPNPDLNTEARATSGAISAVSVPCLAESPDLGAVTANATQVSDHLVRISNITTGN
jgi:hypothetical protein